VADLVDASGHWNLNNMRYWLHSEIINKIVSIPIHDGVDGNDIYVCQNRTVFCWSSVQLVARF